MENSFDEEVYEDYDNAQTDEQKMVYEFIDQLQMLVVEEEFSNMRNSFLQKYSSKFSKKNDNPHECYDIFKSYLESIEKYFTKELHSRIKNLKIEFVIEYLINHKEEELLDEDLLELITSFSDYNVFKNMMMEYNESVDLNLGGFDLCTSMMNENDNNYESSLNFKKKFEKFEN